MIRDEPLDPMSKGYVCVCGGGGEGMVMLNSSHFVFSSPAAC